MSQKRALRFECEGHSSSSKFLYSRKFKAQAMGVVLSLPSPSGNSLVPNPCGKNRLVLVTFSFRKQCTEHVRQSQGEKNTPLFITTQEGSFPVWQGCTELFSRLPLSMSACVRPNNYLLNTVSPLAGSREGKLMWSHTKATSG